MATSAKKPTEKATSASDKKQKTGKSTGTTKESSNKGKGPKGEDL